MRESKIVGATSAGVVALLLGLLLSATGCATLETNTSELGSTTTVATDASSTTTQAELAEENPAVTCESGTSYCLIKDAFTRNGTDYLVVDYIQVKWVGYESDQGESGPNAGLLMPQVTNQNRKLRTFIVPATAKLDFFNGEDDAPKPTFHSLLGHVADGDVNDGYWTDFGFWDIEVSNGEVVSLVSPERPGDGYAH